MTPFNPARPRYTLPLGEKSYDLIGSMSLVEAVEYATGRGIGEAAVAVVNGMPTADLSRLMGAVLSACDHPTTAAEAGDLLWTAVGVTGPANDLLRLHLYSFLNVCLAPPEAREAKAKEMGELIGKLDAASPGKPTRKSVSASSAGSRPNSGKRQRGTSPAPTKGTR